jgi:hypothetical protein
MSCGGEYIDNLLDGIVGAVVCGFTGHPIRVQVAVTGTFETCLCQPSLRFLADSQKVDGPVRVSWQKTISTRRREILLPEGISPQHARPIRSETRAILVASILRGCRWLEGGGIRSAVRRDQAPARKPANSGLFAKSREISVRLGLRGLKLRAWLSFVGAMKDSLWSVDLFRCESILLRSHWVMVVMDVFTRRIIGFGVERADFCGASVCRMFNRIIAGKALPRHLSSDHDPLFRFHRWRANLRIFEVEEIKSIPYVPMSHPFVEQLIGTVRREFLDHVLIWNAVDLERSRLDGAPQLSFAPAAASTKDPFSGNPQRAWQGRANTCWTCLVVPGSGLH